MFIFKFIFFLCVKLRATDRSYTAKSMENI